jgi:O-methyltransferase/methyltransferase family protein
MLGAGIADSEIYFKVDPMSEKLPPPAAMFALITGRLVSQMIYVAAKLELADRLKHGPLTIEELAAATEVQAPALYRVLRGLASFGVFAETKNKRFKLTPLAVTLQKAAPGSMHAAALLWDEKYQEDAWAQLLHGLKTGEIPFFKAHGVSYFEYLEKHPEHLKVFGETMTSVSSTENPAIAAAYKFSGIRTLVDVGGGNGSLLATILKANPKLKGVLFDLHSVTTRAKQDRHVTAKGIAERCTLESGNFFEAVPKGGDAYIMKRTLHDWDDERCAKILANCRNAMSEKGRVLVVESVIPPGNDPHRGKLLDIQMLVIGGRERTKQEFAAVFREAGLKLTRVLPTKCPLSIVEGVRT